MSTGLDDSRVARRAIPAHAREWLWPLPDGHKIRRISLDPPAGTPPRGSILFMPGRADFYEKYLETLEEWAAAGWHVSAADWRGQGASGRMTANPLVGHIEDFSIWISDLGALWRDWVRTAPGPHVLAGHSMGGHLVLRAVAEGAANPEAVVLSAPMLGFVTSIPQFVQHVYGKIMCGIGDPQRMAWKTSEKPGALRDDRMSLLTHDAERYADELWWRAARPELEIGPASWRWVERAGASIEALRVPGVLEAVMAPVLVLAAMRDALVSWPAIDEAAARLPRGELVAWGPEARHELLREVDPVRGQVMAAISSFLDRAVPARTG